MSRVWKYLIFSCIVSGVLGITNVRDDSPWFKNRNKNRHKFASGALNGIHDTNCEETINGAAVQGQCTTKLECSRMNGNPGKPCSLLGVCCIIEKTCSNTTSSKLSYFVTPSKFTADCPLTVNVYSKDVCQIRLDFEEFELDQPTSDMIPAQGAMPASFTAFKCQTDTFKVEEARKNLGFSALCGKNKGQHIYIPILENQSKIVLRFNVRERAAGQNLREPKWRIKIQQLECQRDKIPDHQHLNAPSKLMTLYNSLKNKKRPKSDYDLIAPPNCLQYFPENTGQFESFNYDGGSGVYLGGLNYAICFRKSTEICGAKYTSEGLFQMNSNPPRANEQIDRCHPVMEAGRALSQDYIRIPGGVTSAREFRDYFCDMDFNMGNTVTGKSFEPLYVGVHTDDFRPNTADANPDNFREIGFRLKYELESGNCNN